MKILPAILALSLVGCSAAYGDYSARYPDRSSYAPQARPDPKTDPNELVRGCESYRNVSTVNVRVVFHHKCVHWKRLIFMVLLSEDGEAAGEDAVGIVKEELGNEITLHLVMRTYLSLPSDPKTVYRLMVIGVKGKIKQPKQGKKHHY